MSLLFTFLNIISAAVAVYSSYDELDYFMPAIDDSDKQIDIYGPRTVILSKLHLDGTLVGFFMNSMISGGTEEFVLAKNITNPYMIFKWQNQPHILINNNNLTMMISPSNRRSLPLKKFQLAKYDFLEEILYSYYNNFMTVYYFPDLQKLSSFYAGPITDFYINNNRFIYTHNCTSFNETICKHGKFKQLIFYNYKKLDENDKISKFSLVPVLFIFIFVIYITYVLVKINK